jgi:hypothetical protein
MYSTCLFCHSDLGKNEAIEHFPVGRRLAFDEAKGRLWVVCRKCERWNLTPLEERWEAIEECERAFRATRLRVSTDQIGLARLKEGLELVRIGEPQRPEMAAWRYGDQFGRRRRRHYALVAGGIALTGTVVIGGPILGLLGVSTLSPVLHLFNAGNSIYRARKVFHLTSTNEGNIRVRLADLPRTKLLSDGDDIVLRLSVVREGPFPSHWKYESGRREVDLTGADAVRAAGTILPAVNRGGGSKDEVNRAVGYLEEAGDPARLFRRAIDAIATSDKEHWRGKGSRGALKNLPSAGRLALEMAAHEDSERRALEGELHVLEEAWRAAEEIAGIADDMFLPASVDEDLARLKRPRDEG